MKPITKLEIQKYFENREVFFASQDLQNADIEIVREPWHIFGQGAFACIAKASILKDESRHRVAIRLMTVDQPGLAVRYQGLTKLSSNEKLQKYLLPVQFRDNEVREEPDGEPVRPVILLEWADGESLAKFVCSACTDFEVGKLQNLRRLLREMRLDLWSEGFSHGDISGQNILVSNVDSEFRLKLIDYDSVWFSEVSDLECSVGVTPLSHPGRHSVIGRHGDLMAFGIIDLALAFLIENPIFGVNKGIFESGKFIIDVDDLLSGKGLVKEIIANDTLRGFCTDLQNYANGPKEIDPSFLEVHFKETYNPSDTPLSDFWVRSIPEFSERLRQFGEVTASEIQIGKAASQIAPPIHYDLFTHIVTGREYGSFGSQMCSWDEAMRLLESVNGSSGNWRLPTVVELNEFGTSRLVKEKIGSDFYWTERKHSADEELHYRMRFNPVAKGYFSGKQLKAYTIGVRNVIDGYAKLSNSVSSFDATQSGEQKQVSLNIHSWLIEQPSIKRLEQANSMSRREMVHEILTSIFSMSNSEVALSEGIDISTLGTILAKLPIDKSGKPEKLYIEVKNVVLQLNQKTRVLGLKLRSDNLKIRAELTR